MSPSEFLDIPAEIKHLVSLCKTEMSACEVWLFGSRARGDHECDSDYDILAVIPDDVPEDIDTPLTTYAIRRKSRANADIVTARYSDFISSLKVTNTISYAVGHEGIRLDV